MIFTDVGFFPFFIIVLVVSNYILRNKNYWRVLFLTTASYFFYATWDWRFSGLILLSTIIDFYCGKMIALSRNHAKRYLIISLVSNLTMLGFFKYFNFFLDNINVLFGEALPYWNIILPVGISFYSFQSMSYTIDIYRKKLQPEKSFIHFAFFVSFFPQLVAGPIVRAMEFLPQVRTTQKITHRELSQGAQIFVYGLFKKVVIANQLSFFSDAVFSNPSLYSTGTIWLAVIAYALQIFCDFSGYSDMAIGCARMLGFKLVKNFNMPYLSSSITEFWRRWHISLSRWIRDYIYIPLGGNRKGPVRTYINLMITMLLGGLWHGASWNFVVWGGLHGGALALERLFSLNERTRGKYMHVITWVPTMIFVLITWVFFRAQDFTTAFIMLQKMFFDFTQGIQWYYEPLFFILAFVVIAHFVGHYLSKRNKHYYFVPLNTFWGWLVFFIALFGVFIFAPMVSQPFIYFQF